MIKTTTWRPDTCDCELEYSWDDILDENTRTHTISKINKACSYHQIADKDKHYNIVLDENQRKNNLLGKILKNVPTAVDEIIQDDGSTTKQLKKGRQYKWSFDANRKLIVDLVGFTTKEKTAIQTLANNLALNKITIT